jgi:hypothetical protein
MAETAYTYSISGDTLNAKNASDTLHKEIVTSSIVTALDRVDTFGDELSIVFKDTLSVGDGSLLTSIVNAHKGVSLVLPPQSVRIQETAMADRQLDMKGILFTAALDSETLFDISFGEDRELQMVHCFVKDNALGDYVEMTVHIPDSSDFEVGKFADTMYIPPDGRITPEPAFDTTTVPAFFVIRVHYVSVATSGPQPTVICHLRTHK